MRVTRTVVRRFQKTIYAHFDQFGRSFPWRLTTDAYEILVSEIMLQQTQTDRVIWYYSRFLARFPDIETLAGASLQEVLGVWQGLGYNRRAFFLKRSAEEIVSRYNGVLPTTIEDLLSLPGIGPYTARAVLTFAFNQPHVLIETNIRAVYLHHFFPNCDKVRDSEILPLIAETLDEANPRRWYYALMDYGAYLKSIFPNPSRRSAHYTRQAPFVGSLRQVRGAILRVLSKRGCRSRELKEAVACELGNKVFNDDRFHRALISLCNEKLVVKREGLFLIPD